MSTTKSLKNSPENLGMRRKGPPDEEFAARFKELCEDKGVPWKNQDVGKFIGKTTTTAWNYMNGVKLPSMDNAIDLAKRFDCTVEWLLTGRGPKEIAKVSEQAVDYAIEKRIKEGEMLDLRPLSNAHRVVVRRLWIRLRNR